MPNRSTGKLRLFAAAATVAAAALMGAQPAAAQDGTTLRVVGHAALRMLDPVNTTAYITRNHGYLIYDVLFANDAEFQPQPELVDKWSKSDDGLTYDFSLRQGVEFSDGAPITAEDCIASIKRWGERDLMGRRLMKLVSSMEPTGDGSFRIVLKKPFGVLIDAMAKPSSLPLFIMPKEVASQPASEPITNYVGSGPFKFLPDQFQPGVKAIYVKNENYNPRDEPPSGMAGGKVAKVDRLEYLSFPDTQTTVNAITRSEVDIVESVTPDMAKQLKDAPQVITSPTRAKFVPVVRFNWLQKPFNDVKARRAALYALDQIDFMAAQIGDPDSYEICGAMFGCGTPLATEVGAVQTADRPNLEKAKELLEESDYDGEQVVILNPTDLPTLSAIPQVMAQLLQQAGFNTKLASMDWSTYLQRRNQQVPVSEGGWSVAFGSWNQLDLVSPLSNMNLDTNGAEGYAGWSSGENMAKLKDEFASASTLEERKAIAEKIQALGYEQVFFIPLGTWKRTAAWRDNIKGRVDAPVPVYWNIEKQ